MISFSSLRAFKTVGLTTLVISLPGHPQGWFLSNSFFLEDVFLWTGHSEYVFLLAFLLCFCWKLDIQSMFFLLVEDWSCLFMTFHTIFPMCVFLVYGHYLSSASD